MPEVKQNGRVTIPKRARDYLGISPGVEGVFWRGDDGIVIIGVQMARSRL